MLKTLTLCSLISFSTFAQNCEKIRAAFDLGNSSTKMKVLVYNSCKKTMSIALDPLTHQKCELKESIDFKGDLEKNNFLSDLLIQKAQLALEQMRELAIKCQAVEFVGVATSAFREATNGQSTISKLEKTTKIKLKIILPEEESILGLEGAIVKTQVTAQNVCLWDISGPSVQFTCSTNQGPIYYLSDLASISFKNYIIEAKIKNGLPAQPRPNSPNPINLEEKRLAENFVAQKESGEIAKKIKDIIAKSSSKILAMGGPHSFSIGKGIGQKIYTAENLERFLSSKLGKTDQELGLDPRVEVQVSNLILVNAFMKTFNIPQVETVEVDLTEGLAVTDRYWNSL